MSSVKYFDYGKTARLILPASRASLKKEDAAASLDSLLFCFDGATK
jgi:hypothetical protein